jgi:8-oxo-dGTP diphosphatase
MLGKTVIKVCLLLERNHKWLFLEQTRKNGGRYSLIGGKVETKEFAVSTIVREAREEVGIELQETDLQLVHILQECKNKKQKFVLFFRTHHWEGEPVPSELHKFKATKWFSSQLLPEQLNKMTRCALERIAQGETFTSIETIEVTREIAFEPSLEEAIAN